MQFKMVSTGDLHFGNLRVDSNHLYEELSKEFYSEATTAHLVTIGGDIYDQLVTVGSRAHAAACKFIKGLFDISDKYGTVIRIMHGTYSHDRDQLSVFSALATNMTKYRIINTIDSEVIDFKQLGLKLRVGYIPDNLAYKESQDAVDHLKKVMQVSGIDKLDVLIGHGTFDHVIPAGSGHKPPYLYSIPQFKNIVEGVIVMSHIHTPSHKDNVYYCGSFERLAHGEEELKGFYTFVFDGKWTGKFIPNRNAVKFISVKPPEELSAYGASSYFKDEVMKKFPIPKGYVRLIHNDPEVRSLCHKICSEEFPDLVFSSKSVLKNNATVEITMPSATQFKKLSLNKNNIATYVCEFLQNERNLHIDVTGITDIIRSFVGEDK